MGDHDICTFLEGTFANGRRLEEVWRERSIWPPTGGGLGICVRTRGPGP